jgi:hypothetical protein
VSGGAEGVDTIAIEWAKANHLPVNVFPADWSKHGKSAGPIRNAEMAKYADALICIRWDYSKGSKNMAELMIKANKPVIQYILPKIEFTNDNRLKIVFDNGDFIDYWTK